MSVFKEVGKRWEDLALVNLKEWRVCVTIGLGSKGCRLSCSNKPWQRSMSAFWTEASLSPPRLPHTTVCIPYFWFGSVICSKQNMIGQCDTYRRNDRNSLQPVLSFPLTSEYRNSCLACTERTLFARFSVIFMNARVLHLVSDYFISESCGLVVLCHVRALG